jgi:hypothetical protein
MLDRWLGAAQWWLQGHKRAQRGRPVRWGRRVRLGNLIADFRFWRWERSHPFVPDATAATNQHTFHISGTTDAPSVSAEPPERQT